MSESVALVSRDLGGEGKPPLVILHGMLGSSRNWQVAGRELSADFHVMALDLRNHGGSPHAEPMTYEAMMADVLAWLGSRGLGRITLLGHSMGGKLAMLIACRQPPLIERLVVVDIAPLDYNWPGRRGEFEAMNELDLDHLKSRGEAEKQMEGLVPELALRKFLLTNLERTNSGGWKWVINLPVLTAALPELERTPLRPEDRYNGPALFISGAKSDYVGPAAHDAILRHFPASRLETIPAAGHNPHIETRETFVRLVLGFNTSTKVAANSEENSPAPPIR